MLRSVMKKCFSILNQPPFSLLVVSVNVIYIYIYIYNVIYVYIYTIYIHINNTVLMS